jgi:integrase
MIIKALHCDAIPTLQHSGAEEYADFINTYAKSKGSAKGFLLARQQFVRQYPDLRDWFKAPLAERVGRLHQNGKMVMTNPVCYHARPYLYYLAIHGYARFDWEWVISLATLKFWHLLEYTGIDFRLEQLGDEAVRFGYERLSALFALKRVLSRLFLHTGKTDIRELSDLDCEEFKEAVRDFGQRPDVGVFFGSVEQYRAAVKEYGTSLHYLHVLLYHRGQAVTEPRRIMPPWKPRPTLPVRMADVLERYVATRRLTDAPVTVERIEMRIEQFVVWLAAAFPGIESFAQVTRDHILQYAEALRTMTGTRTGTPYCAVTRRGCLSCLSVFFRDVASWGWDDVPARPLLGLGDLPKQPQRVPRFIPDEELSRMMTAIRELSCPFQRTALLIARWSGARRGEIRRLEIDCLDAYPDGTSRLRIPAGKTKRERLIPLNEEAAEAIRHLQSLKRGERGFRDSHTGTITHYLFVDYGKLLSDVYLFSSSLRRACQAAGLVTPDGKPLISSHRFRHTVGTQLAEKGAKLHTIMKVLGHSSAGMSMVYAQISDRELLRDYQSVLSPGAIIAGPCAEELRNGEMPQSSIDWLKTNFFKTELELGRCLRLPQEGPCECDLYLNCAKFVTTPEYAPRLRRRRKQEFDLIEDARQRGWDKEVERHRCTVNRIDQLLKELGEPIDGQEAVY